MWKKDSWYFHWCQSPHEETFSTWKIILSSKCFSSTFERSWSTRYASAQRAEPRDSCTACARVDTSKARIPRYEPPKRAYLDTNELLRGRTNTRWASNRKLKNELRRARMSSSTNYYAGGTNTRLHRRLRAKSNRYARTQKSSNSLIRFHCSNSGFLLETGIAGHERLLLAKWHTKSEKKLRKRPFFDSADRHEKLYSRSRLYASAQGRHETGGVLSLFSSLFFDISTKNSMQRWSSDFQGLFCVKIRKMAQGSNDLSTLPLKPRKRWKKKSKLQLEFENDFFSTKVLLSKTNVMQEKSFRQKIRQDSGIIKGIRVRWGHKMGCSGANFHTI